MWLIYAFVTAAIVSVKDVISKKVSHDTNEYVSAFALWLFASLVLLPLVLESGIPELRAGYWLGLASFVVFMPSWSILYMRALKQGSLSLVIPLLAFNPIFVTLLSLLFESTWPSLAGWVGILVVSVGLYILRMDANDLSKDWLTPITSIAKEPAAVSMLLVSLIWAVGVHITKIAIAASSTLFTTFSAMVIGAVTSYVIMRWQRKGSFTFSKRNVISLMTLGTIHGISELTFFTALSLGFVPYVVVIKRLSLPMSSLTGKFFFGEELTKNKLIGIGLIFLGVVLILVG